MATRTPCSEARSHSAAKPSVVRAASMVGAMVQARRRSAPNAEATSSCRSASATAASGPSVHRVAASTARTETPASSNIIRAVSTPLPVV